MVEMIETGSTVTVCSDYIACYSSRTRIDLRQAQIEYDTRGYSLVLHYCKFRLPSAQKFGCYILYFRGDC